MLKVRFLRIGRKNDPSFRLVVTDSRRPPRSAAYLENLGFYNPGTKEVKLKAERINHWIKEGAKLSDTAHNLLIKSGVITGKKIDVSKKPKAGAKEKKEGALT